MTTYIGYPVTLPEAFRILRLEFNADTDRLSYQEEREIIKQANKHCKDRSTLQDEDTKFGIYYTDKGQYIIGYRTFVFSDLSDNFCTIDDALETLTKLKEHFTEDLAKLNADISQVTLYGMEPMNEEDQVLAFPKPFVMNYV